jgi:hypothetical protein
MAIFSFAVFLRELPANVADELMDGLGGSHGPAQQKLFSEMRGKAASNTKEDDEALKAL